MSKNKYSKVIVILVIALNVWFTRKMLNTLPYLNFEPSVLIGAWFAFTTGELWMVKEIRKAKAKSKEEF